MESNIFPNLGEGLLTLTCYAAYLVSFLFYNVRLSYKQQVLHLLLFFSFE
jgi:hypothetical protein